MAADQPTLEGWDSGVVDGAALAEAIERAFDYRGDVTVVTRDGGEMVGYLFNRDAYAARPFVQLFATEGGAPRTIPYADIRAIRFSGRDTAAGNSYAAWLRRREAAKVTGPTRGA